MERLLQSLVESDIFREFPEDIIEKELMPYAKVHQLARGEPLIPFREKCNEFGIVLKGRIAVQHVCQNSKSEIMNVLEPGDPFGVDLAFTQSRVSPFLASATQRSQVVSFPVHLLLVPGILTEETRRQLLDHILQFLLRENLQKEYRMAILFQKSLRGKIMAYLTMESRQQQNTTITVPFNRAEMASYLCINRTCLSRELSLMQQEGILSFEHNTFTLRKELCYQSGQPPME